MDMVALADVAPSIVIEIKWATADNMLGQRVYAANRCFLRRETADALARAQKALSKQNLGIKIWEGYRPMWMQQHLWDEVGDPNLVSDPSRGRRTHIRGVAVDVTLVDADGRELAMPTGYCEFSKREQMKHAYTVLSDEVLKNRATLKKAMTDAGFQIYSNEWWHYNLANWAEFDILEEDELVKKAK